MTHFQQQLLTIIVVALLTVANVVNLIALHQLDQRQDLQIEVLQARAESDREELMYAERQLYDLRWKIAQHEKDIALNDRHFQTLWKIYMELLCPPN